jgi:transposase
LTAAKGSALAGFADGTRRDLDAVRAALALPWSTGPVEGQISYLKTIKRTMCGRASFTLLRQRVLLAA